MPPLKPEGPARQSCGELRRAGEEDAKTPACHSQVLKTQAMKSNLNYEARHARRSEQRQGVKMQKRGYRPHKITGMFGQVRRKRRDCPGVVPLVSDRAAQKIQVPLMARRAESP